MSRRQQIARSKNVRILLIGVVLLGLVWLWFRYNQSPAEGVVINNAVSGNEDKAPAQQKGHYEGSIVSFDYPGSYSSIQNNTPSGLIAEQLSIAANVGTQDSHRISVTVKQFGTGVILEEDAAYKVRMLDTENYSRESATAAGNSAEKFVKKDNTEVVYFIKGPAYYAIIAGTATGGSQSLNEELNQIVNSLSWQK